MVSRKRTPSPHFKLGSCLIYLSALHTKLPIHFTGLVIYFLSPKFEGLWIKVSCCLPSHFKIGRHQIYVSSHARTSSLNSSGTVLSTKCEVSPNIAAIRVVIGMWKEGYSEISKSIGTNFSQSSSRNTVLDHRKKTK